ncbi:Cellulose synthesis protein [Neorhizobium galegae bv. officinalis bv. officinalis str. HAMBI 1141]|uniref:Cellulose synthesis protein n=1 Tax=Neorhizobium galegae bv. officinalis bv. officinalis str. HAMBI 1141 TaxID=1028801 RepID=A0A068TAQ4_NEOGA|nr:amidohydrolase [Neorhizobium galegae]CDN54405.1 Cellulose synthesis protein [Neorhizobium galegae bv. officinalis bv. officinalis str. HAMBI 1141]
MFLSNQDVIELTAWRRKLHAMPEISGEEIATAAEVQGVLADTKPDRIVTGLGGTGVAVIYESGLPGPSVLFRAELDALPIEEIGTPDHRSQIPGKGHMCGHDGHMTMLAALGRQFGRDRPKCGRVILLFQPAEETGAGAAAVIADEKFQELAPDYSFSLHNMPGLPLGHAWLKDGIVNCASRGLKIVLSGRTAHASMPETGISPVPAVATLMPALTALSRGSIATGDMVLATVTHASVGEPAFGIAPGHAEVWVTLRTMTDGQMQALTTRAEHLVREVAAVGGLGYAMDYHDIFGHCENHAEATVLLRAAMEAEGISHEPGETMRGSEDFGRFATVSKSAMFFLGAGENMPNLHNPNYDFPDDLIPIGTKIFMRVARDILG